MSVGGRKPVPTQLRKLHGNPNQKPLPKHEPTPPGDLTEPPPWLSDEQKASWRYALANAPPGLLRRIDRGVLAVWVVAEDLHRQAVTRQNTVANLLVQAPGGSAIQSPYLPVINRQALIMIKAAGEMGFTPVSRPRIFGGFQGDAPMRPVTQEPDGAVPLDEYLARPPDEAVH
jgi:phage terminase small subunit